MVAFFFSLAIPALQIALHLRAGSGLFTGRSTEPETGVGILYNLPDSLSYASWATQAGLGYLTFSDLFTTDPHPPALFNLYFLAVGWLSRILAVDPLALMQVSSLLLGPVAVFLTLRIARELAFDKPAQALGLVFVFLGSGISGLLFLLDNAGLHLMRPGADAFYLDLFPLAGLVFYPFHAATFVLLALIVLASIRVLGAPEDPARTRRALLLGALFFVTELVRPYEATTLVLVFNLAALANVVAGRGAGLKSAVATCVTVNLLALPPVAYAAFMTTQPVWNSFAENSLGFQTDGPLDFLKGFAFLWAGAALGIAFVVTDRRRDLHLLACWSIVSAAMLLLSSHYGTKFAGGSVLADGLLAAYGIRRLAQEAPSPAARGALRPLVILVVGVMSLTPLVAFADVFQVGSPKVDSDLLAAGKRIRDLEGDRIPVVLTDSRAGAVLAALFGERVYAGHWSLTPDYRRKTAQLGKAGIEPSPVRPDYDADLLRQLVREQRPQYFVVSRTAPAFREIAACSTARPVYQSDRWIAVSAVGWSCS